ncbi:hypothetical protein Peur_021581 [Populus x canadensis]
MAFIPKTSTFSLEKKSSFIFNLTLPQSTAYPLSINFGWTILLISFPFIFLHYHPLTQQQLPFPTMTVTTVSSTHFPPRDTIEASTMYSNQ